MFYRHKDPNRRIPKYTPTIIICTTLGPRSFEFKYDKRSLITSILLPYIRNTKIIHSSPRLSSFQQKNHKLKSFQIKTKATFVHERGQY